MKNNHKYETAIEAIQGLRKEGYLLDFRIKENYIFCKDCKFETEEFEITNIFRFEGDIDSLDDVVVYAIQSNKNLKGILVTAYAISVGPISPNLMAKLSMRDYALMRA